MLLLAPTSLAYAIAEICIIHVASHLPVIVIAVVSKTNFVQITILSALILRRLVTIKQWIITGQLLSLIVAFINLRYNHNSGTSDIEILYVLILIVGIAGAVVGSLYGDWIYKKCPGSITTHICIGRGPFLAIFVIIMIIITLIRKQSLLSLIKQHDGYWDFRVILCVLI